MTYQGIDTAARVSASSAVALKENGISFVGRYLVPPSMPKFLSYTEAEQIRSTGLAILLIWESTAERARFGAQAGKDDGTQALIIAQSYKIPYDCAIYFAVDYDAPRSDYAVIEQYLYAAKQAIAPYRIGVYGKSDLINSIKCDCYMQCVAWSYGAVSAKNNVYQYAWQGDEKAKALANKVGFAVDLDRCDDMKAAGMWLPPEKSNWYDDAMAWAAETGLMNDGRPLDYVTRAELATVMQRFYNKYINV